ncbi:hypothetical protein GUJ93_ZPchr0009g1998 [Zizania palustris]|uniref:Uncharacterized protein n=1 Tax=Zizania palustris TaxID=103762 RepID=A0A8J5V2Q1_ZIZPA|nr:hypothetical protein GUJ93_ZPchr0009g1998 [Zizania palustris]
MTLTIPDDVRAKAEVYVGDAAGKEKTRLLLEETGLPSGLLPLQDIIECGYVEETGFVWLKQKKKVDHYFAKAGRHVSYATEVSAIADKGRLKKITGVKAKELLIWVTLHEICLDDPPTGKLVCKAIGGLSRSFPAEAFVAEAPPPPPNNPADTQQATNGEAAKKETTNTEQQANDDKEDESATATATATAAAIDEIDEKMKEMNKEKVVQAAEAVPLAAKN